MGVIQSDSFYSSYLGDQIDLLLAAIAEANPLPSGMDWVAFIDDCRAAQAAALASANAAAGSATDADTSATLAGNRATASSSSAAAASASATLSQSWTVGGTGTRTGEDTNNAKYWADQAHQIARDTLIDSVTGRTYSLIVSNGRLMLQEV